MSHPRPSEVQALAALLHTTIPHHYRGGVDDDMARMSCEQGREYGRCKLWARGLHARGVRVAPSPTDPLRGALIEFLDPRANDEKVEVSALWTLMYQHPVSAAVRGVAPSPDAPGPAAVKDAQIALVSAIEKRTWEAAGGIMVPGGGPVNEAIRNFRAAVEAAALAASGDAPREELDVERLIDRARFATLTAESVPYAKDVTWNKGWAAAIEAIREAAQPLASESHPTKEPTDGR